MPAAPPGAASQRRGQADPASCEAATRRGWSEGSRVRSRPTPTRRSSANPPPTDGDLVSWLLEPMLERAGFAIEEVSDSQPQV
jgi:hypothetical protein